jgi:hypothetical protein
MQLRDVARLSRSEKRVTAVVVSRSDTTYWGMLPDWRTAFVAPAMTEVAAIDGLPGAPPAHGTYGFSSYVLRAKPLSLVEATRRATQLGFDRLVVFDGGRPGGRSIQIAERR